MHTAIVLLVLVLTYLGMAAGRIAWLQVDRTGIALLAVIALLASGEMTLDEFGSAVDMPTLALLFAMMIISAQLAESGFIDLCARTMVEMPGGTTALLGLTVAIAAVTEHVLDRNQTIKGGVAVLALLILFSTPLPREIGALIIAALLLANRKITSRTMIAAVDWPLLLLVSCLFAITGQLNDSGLAAKVFGFLDDRGLLPNHLLLLLPFAMVPTHATGS